MPSDNTHVDELGRRTTTLGPVRASGAVARRDEHRPVSVHAAGGGRGPTPKGAGRGGRGAPLTAGLAATLGSR